MLLDPSPSRIRPGKAESGHLRRSAAAELDSGDQLRRPRVPSNPIRPILDQRPRLEPKPFRSKPSDLDPTGENRTYPFGLALFLKTPPCFLLSTRSPPLLKNNCGLAQFLASKPLDFYLLEPAVQTLSFCTLALRFNC